MEKKKIGFIDYFIDEWHANKYPSWIRASSYKDMVDVAFAWEEISKTGGKNLDQWCKEQNVKKANSLAQIVDECDYIIVLSPDNPERHEDLTDLPLRSGKPVYIDKTFATSHACATRMLDKAVKHQTPMFTSSALRFSPDLANAKVQLEGKKVNYVASLGAGSFGNYAIHQLEPLVSLLGTGAKRVMFTGTPAVPALLIDYADGRRASTCHCPGQPFHFSVHGAVPDN